MNISKDIPNRFFREVCKCSAILLVVVLLSSLLLSNFSFAESDGEANYYPLRSLRSSSFSSFDGSLAVNFSHLESPNNFSLPSYSNITSSYSGNSYDVSITYKLGISQDIFNTFYIFNVGSVISPVLVSLSQVSYSSNPGLYIYNSSGRVDNGSSVNNRSFTYSEEYDLYYYSIQFNSYNINSTDVPVFDSISSGLASIRDFLDNGSSSVFDFESTIEVPAGSVAYIGVPSGGTLSMSGTTTFPINSTLFGSDKFPEAPQRVSRASSLPVSGTQFPLTPNSKPNWQRSEDGRNLFGQTRSAYFSSSDWSFDSTGFLTFYNPYYFNPVDSASSDQSSTLNSSVYLTISGYSSIRIYPLQDAFYTDGSISGSSPDDFQSYWDGEITDNGDGTGSVSFSGVGGAEGSQPSNNGYNQAPVQQGILKYIEDIRNTLSKFVNDVLSLLQAPISHISQLIEAGSGFMNGLRGLYSWLPIEVQSHLISALTLVIVIGVFKVFL